jgi:hypothetical protein
MAGFSVATVKGGGGGKAGAEAVSMAGGLETLTGSERAAGAAGSTDSVWGAEIRAGEETGVSAIKAGAEALEG